MKITWSRYGIPKPLGGVHNMVSECCGTAMKTNTQRIVFSEVDCISLYLQYVRHYLVKIFNLLIGVNWMAQEETKSECHKIGGL